MGLRKIFPPLVPIIFLLLIGCGVFLIACGVRIWVKKTALIADPILWGPTTGFIGYIIARALVGDAEVEGRAARLIALFYLILGLCLILAGSMCIVAKKNSTPRVAAVRSEVTEPASDHGAAFHARTDLEGSEPQVANPVATSASPPPPPAPAPQGPGTVAPMKKDWIPEGMERRRKQKE